MRAVSIYLLLAVVGIGCKAGTDAQQSNVPTKSESLGDDNRNDDTDASEFSHIVASEADYYTSGPQQGRPPDGRFPAGTEVTIVEDAGSYLLVRSGEGVEAYVAADAVEPQKGSTVDFSEIVEGSNRFALDLYQQLGSEQGNLFFSPTSISTALAMLYAGAEGKTESEMAKTLHFQVPNDQLHEGMEALQASWKRTATQGEMRLDVANRLWGQQSYEFLPEFLKTTRNQYGAELARLDFGQSEQARQTINSWIEEQTENKITDLIPPGVLSSNTRLVLTNAIYFHGNWTQPFDEDRTEEEDFHVTAADKVQVPMMHRSGEYRYGAVDDLQVLQLPYGEGNMSMIVLLPREGEGLPDLEAELTLKNLERWTGALKREDEVKVYLPRFKTTSQLELSGTLGAMGMPLAFDPDVANFSGMTRNRELFLSAAIHKAFVDVNEEGTEATAATGLVVGVTSVAPSRKEPPVFRADHPFVFLIRDNRTDAVLFLGRITNPLE